MNLLKGILARIKSPPRTAEFPQKTSFFTGTLSFSGDTFNID
jgi:hypothetical protein